MHLKSQSGSFQVGPIYGRKTMKGYIDQKVNRVFVSERRAGSSLRRVAPYYHNHRQRGNEQLIPQPYTAEYHGHKLHMGQLRFAERQACSLWRGARLCNRWLLQIYSWFCLYASEKQCHNPQWHFQVRRHCLIYWIQNECKLWKLALSLQNCFSWKVHVF